MHSLHIAPAIRRSLLRIAHGSLLVALGTVAAAQSEIFVSPTGDDTTGDGSSGTPYKTVVKAISAAAASGDTIRLTDGTFGDDEQIEITNKSVTIVGAGRGVTFVRPHATLAFSLPAGSPLPGTVQDHAASIVINGPVHVGIRELTIDAAFRMPGTGRLHGIIVLGGGDATIDDVEIVNARANPLTGAQGPTGLVVYGNAAPDSCDVVLRRSLIHEFGKNAIVQNFESYLLVEDCDIVGAGPIGTPLPAQNGIQMSRGARGAIRNCRVRDIYYSGPSWTASGILLYDQGPGVVLEGNSVVGCQTAIYAYDSSAAPLPVKPLTIRGNTVTESDWAVYLHNEGTTVTNNVLHGATYQNASDDTGAGTTNVWSGNNYSDYTGGGTYAIPDGTLVDTSPRSGCDALVAGTPVALGEVPVEIVALELSGDALVDFATANEGATFAAQPSLSIGINNGAGFTVTKLLFGTAGANPTAIAAGELDGSPGTDLVVVTASENFFYVFANDGAGGFSLYDSGQLPAGALAPADVAVADLDGSSVDEIVVATRGGLASPGGGFVLVDGGASSFVLPGTFTAQCKGVAAGDLDGGSGLDLVLTEGNGTFGRVHLYANDGSGGFTELAVSPIAVDSDPTSVAVFDVDGDLDGDVLSTSTNAAVPLVPGSASVLLNDGAGGFAADTHRVGAGPQGIVAGDLSADADPDTARYDALAVNFADGTLTTLSEYGLGGFGGNLLCDAGTTPRSAALADVDGDGLVDVLVADAATQQVLVLTGVDTARTDYYGTGCPGSYGKIPVIRPSGAPAIAVQPNFTFGFDLDSARPFSFGVLIASGTPAAGLGPCELLLATVDVSVAVFTNSVGAANVPVPVIGNPPDLSGTTLYFQYAVLDPYGEFFDLLSLSEGLKVRVGI